MELKQYYEKKVSDEECHCKFMDGIRLGNCPYCEKVEMNNDDNGDFSGSDETAGSTNFYENGKNP